MTARVAALAAITAGCAPTSGMTTVRTLERGADQWAIAPELNPTPELGVGYRRGVGARIELDAKVSTLLAGSRLNTAAFELAARRPVLARGHFELGVQGVGGYRLIQSGGATWEAGYGELAVLAGIKLRRRLDQLVIGPRLGYQRWYSAGSMPVGVPIGAVSIGYAWAVRPGLTIFPELGVGASTTPLAEVTPTSVVRFGVGFLFGH